MPNYADTDGATLKALEEVTYGVTPANSANWKAVRAKGWNIKPAIGVVESEEISSNVDVVDAVTVSKMGQFSMNGEYAKDPLLETFLEHLFRANFATNVLKGGILKKSLTFEELSVGAANEFALMSGVRLDSLAISGRVGGIIETSFGGMGGTPTFSGTSGVGTGTTAAVGANRVMTMVDVTAFAMTGDTTPLTVLDFNIALSNSTREQMGAGSSTLQGVGYGTRRVNGSFTAYFETREQLAKLVGGAKQDLSITLSDGTNSHIWRMPALKFLDVDKAVGGRSSDITQRIDFVATYAAGSATAVQVTRTP